MKRASITLVLVFALLAAFSSLAYAQMAEKERKKTVTLPSGEVIYDLNGEWAACMEHYGSWAWVGTYPEIVEIKQQGTSFVGIKLIGSQWVPKGSETIRGELDKSGFKKVQIMSAMGPQDAEGEISESGNKIIIDAKDKIKITLIRR